jgi:hypothetical protein
MIESGLPSIQRSRFMHGFSKLTRTATKHFSIALAGIALVGLSRPAGAATILDFAQSAAGTIVATDNGSGVTTLTTPSSISVHIDQLAGLNVSLNAYETFVSVQSTDAASDASGPIIQHFSGTIEFTSAANGTGTNYLTAVFNDFTAGSVGGGQASLNASTPPSSNVVYTSDVMSFVNSTSRNFSLGLSGITPALAISGDNSLASFTATSNAGTFYADTFSPVPEPSSLIMASSSAFAGLGYWWRRRRAARA